MTCVFNIRFLSIDVSKPKEESRGEGTVYKAECGSGGGLSAK